MNANIVRGLVAVGALTLAGASQAAATAVDVTDLVANIAAQATPIGLVGSAILLIYMAVKAFKFIRAAMS